MPLPCIAWQLGKRRIGCGVSYLISLPSLWQKRPFQSLTTLAQLLLHCCAELLTRLKKCVPSPRSFSLAQLNGTGCCCNIAVTPVILSERNGFGRIDSR